MILTEKDVREIQNPSTLIAAFRDDWLEQAAEIKDHARWAERVATDPKYAPAMEIIKRLTAAEVKVEQLQDWKEKATRLLGLLDVDAIEDVRDLAALGIDGWAEELEEREASDEGCREASGFGRIPAGGAARGQPKAAARRIGTQAASLAGRAGG